MSDWIEPFTISDLAQAVVLGFGAFGSLLLVIWQSNCICDLNLCWCCKCHREPRPLDDEEKQMKGNKNKNIKKESKVIQEETLLPPVLDLDLREETLKSPSTASPVPSQSSARVSEILLKP